MMKLASIIADGAVFQRDMFVPVWGKTEPECLVSAEMAGKKVVTLSNREGEFMLRLPPMNAGGPFTLVLTNGKTGEKQTVNDILVGEVWIASGQSNMAYLLGTDWVGGNLAGAAPEEKYNWVSRTQEREFIQEMKHPERFRAFSVPTVVTGAIQTSCPSKWVPANAENAPGISAAAAWFGKFIQDNLDVPVGIIVSAWGGTKVESWTSRAGLLSNPDTAGIPDALSALFASAGEKIWVEAPAFDDNLFTKDRENKGFAQGWADPGFDDSDWKDINIPGSWIQQKISGNGSVWARVKTEIPSAWEGRDLILNLGGVDKQDISYFNGVEVGRTGKDLEYAYWETPRSYRIPGKLVKAGKAVVAVRGYSFVYDGAFTGAALHYSLELKENGEKIPLAGLWKAQAETDLGIVAKPEGKNIWGPKNEYSPCILFNDMIAPLLPYGIRGAIWYQGESDETDPKGYRGRIKAMIQDWRNHWEQGNFPFIQTQLAGYRTAKSYDDSDAWPRLRESQRMVCEMLPNVSMASAVDIGEANDIHPQDKKTVGFRLAQCALSEVYHCAGVVPCGPLFEKIVPEGNGIRVVFRHGDGMFFKNGKAKGFYLAESDRVFVPADEAVIEGNSVLLKHGVIKNPYAVRYSWADNPDGNLYNGAGLPASPFRSDDW